MDEQNVEIWRQKKSWTGRLMEMGGGAAKGKEHQLEVVLDQIED